MKFYFLRLEASLALLPRMAWALTRAGLPRRRWPLADIMPQAPHEAILIAGMVDYQSSWYANRISHIAVAASIMPMCAAIWHTFWHLRLDIDVASWLWLLK